MDEIAPASVVDVGCGLGAWLAVFLEHGVSDVVGLDGPWVDQTVLEIDPADFRVVRPREDRLRSGDASTSRCASRWLNSSIRHSPSSLCCSLTTLSDVIVFSSAIPGQGGLGHVNEQWPRYWANLFAQHSYIATDPFRLRIWEEPDVKWWFAQNTICLASTRVLPRFPASANTFARTAFLRPSSILAV